MRKISSYTFTTLNGFYKGPGNDVSWNKHGDPEEAEFAAENAQGGNTLLFGRVTYEMMAGFWPTDQAMQMMPGVAKGMNSAEKIVVSRTLKSVDWQPTTILSGDLIEEVRKLKQSSGNNITILGSGSIVAQLADAGLIDEFQVMVNPVAIGAGTPLFEGMSRQLDLQLVSSRVFKKGSVLLNYKPV